MIKSIVVAFDFDGVIADTISMLKETFSTFLREYKIDYSEELFEKYNGATLVDMIRDLKTQYCISKAPEALLSDYQELISHNAIYVKPVDGALSTIKTLYEQGYTLVVSSSASEKYIDDFLTKNNVRDFFDTIFSGSSCSHTKPDKLYYLNIKNHYEGYELFVIEDSYNGLVSAFNAGAITICYNEINKLSLAPHHYYASNLNQIPDIITHQANKGYFIRQDAIEVVIMDTHPVFSAEEQKSIEEIWSKRPKHVFNGSVIAYSQCYYDNGRLIVECYVTEYRYVYSIRSRITPLAVSGICIDSNNNTLVSVRNKVTDYSGSYELIPSGGIDKKYLESDTQGYKKQLLTEFLEEVGPGVSEKNVSGIDSIGLCYDTDSNTMDICMKIKYDGYFASLCMPNNTEYDCKTTMIDNVESIKRFLADKETVITSQMILNNV